MFLAIDSVFGQCSVALINTQGDVLSLDTKMGNREQTQQILPMIDTALKNADVNLSALQALIFNRGPGAFSGIRINTAVVQALSVAQDIPCVGVSSLQILAQTAHKEHGISQCHALLDARMKQVYCAQYQLQAGIMTQVENSQEYLLDYDSCLDDTLALVGNGARLVEAAQAEVYADIEPNAAILATLGKVQFEQTGGVDATHALPVYLRNDAWKTLKQQKAHKGLA
ncbi:tRNA (adenosine(37)-N6)-threonylcarbamoyltransferase complex dimerization subunit type 1 TsaB [Psychrobacter sp. I-STPA10]|uniref:tRNA (adenosine(37)-N6)-threonylcarbamoyltransferase complex dimerization subunit type 1 TsaB n=1 Tax=Psychrobacter sp. I-STPA10 TaxID=2585769 RepID=UPI001E4FAA48|nr:tRNA (adenosine(37)-N6)-threonylcarbamoyltransferase complex dimerization subunit type 1 TsaB [Psychrobacter sp. I-STPA10]